MTILQDLLVTAIPGTAALLFPALGELITERSGIVNLGIEASMLAGALTSVAISLATGSPMLAVVGGAAAGLAIASIHALAVVTRRANPLASGLVIWFLALGLTSVLGARYIGAAANPLPTLPLPILADVPVIGPIFDQNLLVYAALILVPTIAWTLGSTRYGLLLRGTGERPAVLVASGHHPQVIRFVAICLGGALAGLGGTQLSIGMVGNWVNGMTNGYGFIAVAVVTFARWNPWGALGGSALFGATLATASLMQAHGLSVNQYLLDALPYLVTLIVLVLVSRYGRTPAPEAQRDALSLTA